MFTTCKEFVEGTVFSHFCHSFQVGVSHVTITHDALNLTTQNSSQCFNIAIHYLGSYVENNLIWKFNINQNEVVCNFNPSFWRDVLKSLSKVNFRWPQSWEAILNQIIWFNSNIKAANNVLTPLTNRFNCWRFVEGKLLEILWGIPNDVQGTIKWIHCQTVLKSILPYWKYLIVGEDDSFDNSYDEHLQLV